MTIEDSVIEPIEESDLKTEESVIMSMDNIVLEGDGLGMGAILDKDLAVDKSGDTSKAASLELEDNQTDGISEAEVDDKELIPEIDRVPERIEKLLIPLEGNPVGEDPRYGDEFVLIKTEIDKLAFNDYNAVMTLAEEILKNVSKDIRVAGYFMLANTYINGAKGLIEGLILYRLLLEKFGDDLYPTKESARNTSMLWLNNNKLSAYVKQHQAKVSLETVEMVAKQIERLNEAIVSVTNDETLCLNSIRNWIKETRKKIDIPPPPKVEVKADDGLLNESSKNATPLKNDVTSSPRSEVSRGEVAHREVQPLSDIEASSTMSDTELYSLIRKVVNQLMTDKEFARGIAYARAARWGGFLMPPHENNKTRITPPRQTGVNEITALLAAGDNEEALKKCEGIFFEMGGHILLDLQMYAHKAAKALGKMEAANLIAFETVAFLQRFPGIEELRFDDDMPCAKAECRTWLNKLGGNGQADIPLITADQDSEELLESINKACEEANDKDLNAGLTKLDEYRPETEKQRFQLQLAMSQLCLDHGRAEMALPMLDELTNKANRTSLATWDVRLAMSAARQLQNALRSVMANASEQNRTRYERRLEEVTAQMCRWDLAQAAHYL